MSPSRADVDAQLSRLGNQPYGLARSHAVEQLVRRIEVEGPVESLAYGFSTLVDSYVWSGEVDKAYVPFTRWVRWFDEHPEHFDEQDRFSLFWSFKWMVSHLKEFPSVPSAQIEATLEDMARRYALAGNGENGVRLERFRWAEFRGDPRTDELYEEWAATPRDEYAQCEACDPSERSAYLLDTDRAEEAVRLLERTLADDPTCGTEPADMFSQLAEGQLRLGRPVEAARAFRRALHHLADSESDMTTTRGRLIEVLAAGGQDERLVTTIEADERFLLEADTPASRLSYLRSVAAATNVLLAAGVELPVRLATVPAATTSELHSWALAEARALAAQFDTRNGSGHQGELVEATLSAVRAPSALDLSVIAVPTGEAPTASSAPGPGAREGAEPVGADDAATLAARADKAVSAGDLETAVPLYLEAARLAREAGELLDAGLAEANAARGAHLLSDTAGADAAYRHAVGVLKAAGAQVLLLGAVVRSWTPVAFDAGSHEAAIAELDELRARIGAELDAARSDEPSAAPRGDDAALRTELAELLDTAARGFATLGEHSRAIELANESAERFAGLSRFADAAFAFELAGKAHLALGSTSEAVYFLESAFEGFSAARRRDDRARAADQLVEALRALGREEEAAKVAASLVRS